MRVFVTNFGDRETFAAELDDPSFRDAGLDGLASPQFFSVLSSLDADNLAILREACIAELSDPADWSDCPEARYVWGPLEHHTPEHGRENWTQALNIEGDPDYATDPDFGAQVALLVIQAVELD